MCQFGTGAELRIMFAATLPPRNRRTGTRARQVRRSSPPRRTGELSSSKVQGRMLQLKGEIGSVPLQ